MADVDDDHVTASPDDAGFAERWALVIGSVGMSVCGSMLALLMAGGVLAGADWLAPLLSLVVLMFGVMAVGLAAAAIVTRREGGWAAMAFALLPCAAVIAAWAWAIYQGRWGPGA